MKSASPSAEHRSTAGLPHAPGKRSPESSAPAADSDEHPRGEEGPSGLEHSASSPDGKPQRDEDLEAVRAKFVEAMKQSRADNPGGAYKAASEAYLATIEHAGDPEWDRLRAQVGESLDALAAAANAAAATDIQLPSKTLILQ